MLAALQIYGCGSSAAGPIKQQQPHSTSAAPSQSSVAGRPVVASGSSAASSASPVAPSRAKTRQPIAPAHPVPAAFRPAAGAPSDAQVRSELAQVEAIQHEERKRQLSAAAANLAGLLPWTQELRSGVQVSVASVFRDYGLGLACGGVLGRAQLGVAHKTAPCGTLITFSYAGRSLTVPVIDRGPYIAGREWDLTGATAEALGFPGLGQIAWAVAR